MQAQYVALYKLEGINRLSSENEIYVNEMPEISARAFLTETPDTHFYNGDRGNVLKFELLRGFFGQSTAENIDEAIKEGIQTQVEQRAKKFGKGAFLIFSAVAEIGNPDFKIRRDFDNFSTCFDAFEKTRWQEIYKEAEDRILVSFAMALPANKAPTFKRVCDAMYLVEASGRIIYSFTLTAGGARAIISGPPADDLMEAVKAYVASLGTNSALVTVSKLFAQSLDRNFDELRAFIAIWSATEIFINKVFGDKYDGEWNAMLADKRSRLIKELGVPTNGRYGLAAKFSIISAVLDEQSAQSDCELFKTFNAKRNVFFHGGDKSEKDLPVESLQGLLRKYLRLHLAHITSE